MKTVVAVGLLLVSILIATGLHQFTKSKPLPVVLDEYWGPSVNQDKPEDTTIYPFQINVSDVSLEFLKGQLERELRANRLIEPLEDVGFEYGFNSKYLQNVGQYWLQKYDWREREKRLNKYPQFKTKIAGLDIHFYHVKPSKVSSKGPSRPLLLLHGWPSNLVEYYKMIDLLTEPKNSEYSYELVIPSLPGYGFSSAARRPGFNSAGLATVFNRLMQRLGHQKYFTLGGDWGSAVVHDMATLYSSNVIGALSLNCVEFSPQALSKFVLSSLFPSIFVSSDIVPHILTLRDFVSYSLRESGYLLLQSTKPDTAGAALTHSPLGLAAYIMEKFSTWTNRTWIGREDGGLEEKYTLDELLDNVMIYWVTGSITSSQRLYSEYFNPSKIPNLDNVPTDVPFDCFNMPEDIFLMNEFSVRHKFTNIRRFKVATKGGHFGASEEPHLVSAEALSFFNSLTLEQ